jgi:hypothetical protein
MSSSLDGRDKHLVVYQTEITDIIVEATRMWVHLYILSVKVKEI